MEIRNWSFIKRIYFVKHSVFGGGEGESWKVGERGTRNFFFCQAPTKGVQHCKCFCLVKLNNNINKTDYCRSKRFHFNLKLFQIRRYRQKSFLSNLLYFEALYWRTDNLFSFIFKCSLAFKQVLSFWFDRNICNLIQTFLIIFHFKLARSMYSSTLVFRMFLSFICNRVLMILLIRYSLVRH